MAHLQAEKSMETCITSPKTPIRTRNAPLTQFTTPELEDYLPHQSHDPWSPNKSPKTKAWQKKMSEKRVDMMKRAKKSEFDHFFHFSFAHTSVGKSKAEIVPTSEEEEIELEMPSPPPLCFEPKFSETDARKGVSQYIELLKDRIRGLENALEVAGHPIPPWVKDAKWDMVDFSYFYPLYFPQKTVA